MFYLMLSCRLIEDVKVVGGWFWPQWSNTEQPRASDKKTAKERDGIKEIKRKKQVHFISKKKIIEASGPFTLETAQPQILRHYDIHTNTLLLDLPIVVVKSFTPFDDGH